MSADLMLTVINDILDFSKIEAGRLELDPIRFNVRDLVEESIRTLALRAQEKGLELLGSVSTSIPEYVVADVTRLRQILVNLMGNAIKFTATGEVHLEVEDVRRGGDGEAGDWTLHFVIRDTGIGIAPEKQKIIFEAFSQADQSTTRRFGGTGLGLAISKHLVTAMGGQIWVESEAGVGSQFHFTVAAGRVSDFQPAPKGNVSLEGVSVLAVDDNATSRLILREVLRSWGMHPQTAASAGEAVALINDRKASDDPFQVVLTDLHMPDIDGFGLVEQIHALGEGKRQPVVLMVTASAQMGDLARSSELGVSAYLTKPVRRRELRAAITAALLNEKQPADEFKSAPKSQPEAAHKLQILLAEDNVVNQRVACGILRKAGHSVVIASDGTQVMPHLLAGAFDVVLMDIQMPGMDGFEATAAIRESENGTGRRIPIIAMTAHAIGGYRERCLAGGMDGYVSKPVRVDVLLDLLASLQTTAPTDLVST